LFSVIIKPQDVDLTYHPLYWEHEVPTTTLFHR